MTYSAMGLLAIIIFFIINQSVLWKGGHAEDKPAQRAYRHFLYGMLAFFVTDALWGILDALDMNALLYADTVVYFAAMAAAVLLWTRYVITYLEDKDAFSRFISGAGKAFFAFELVVLAVNFFRPVLFWFDGAGNYHAGSMRYVTLGVQIAVFLLASSYTLTVTAGTEGLMRRRYRAIGTFGIAMTVFVGTQLFYPLLPLYSVGYLLGNCLLHTFVVEGEKEEYRRELEEALQREKQQQRELGSAKRLAYTDPLTHVKSKHAYVEHEAELDRRIAERAIEAFGVMVFDVNGLKRINDTRGHEVGDQYIVAACRLICNHFKHSPVFRIGGDEFVAFLDGQDYREREALQTAFDARIRENLRAGRVVVASGMAEFDANLDHSYRSVFDRADERMYQNKRILKELERL